MRDFKSDRYTNSRLRRDFARQSETTNAQNIGVVFREPVHQVLEKSKANHTLDGRIRWREIPQSETKTFIANTTKTTDIPQRIARTSGITWTSWSEKEI